VRVVGFVPRLLPEKYPILMSICWLPNRHRGDRFDTIEFTEDRIMRYCLLMHYQEASEIGLTEEDMAPAMAAFQAYARDLDKAGVLVTTQVLEPSAATTTVTARNGSPEIQDGPFADTKERLGGIFVIDVPDLDAALDWAKRNPAAQWGSIEIRPVARTYTGERGEWYTP
jgi:hypothetical protein